MPVKILLVEAQEGVEDLIRETTRLLQWCEVVSLTESSKAADLLQRVKFDGVILDAHMPDPDGFELTRMIRKGTLNKAVPVVMLTDDENVEKMRQGFRAGVTFFMTKPSSRERVYGLFNAVRGAMTRERRRHARLPFRAQVTCCWGEHEENRFTGESLTISEGGMAFHPSGGLEVGKEINLTFALPELPPPDEPSGRRPLFAEGSGSQEGRLRAVVRYRNPQDVVGVEFLSIPSMYHESIQRFITGEED
jgi:two-component system chemotaxis response regulator CheY